MTRFVNKMDWNEAIYWAAINGFFGSRISSSPGPDSALRMMVNPRKKLWNEPERSEQFESRIECKQHLEISILTRHSGVNSWTMMLSTADPKTDNSDLNPILAFFGYQRTARVSLKSMK